jgi:Excalibur calcium-binding domain
VTLAKILVASTCVGIATLGSRLPAQASVPAKWANCTTVNKRLPHGVGLKHAHDHTSGTPVTSFRHDSALYHTAMRANSRLDGDKDGIACERA